MLLVKRPLVCCGVSCILGCFAGKWFYEYSDFSNGWDGSNLIVYCAILIISILFYLMFENNTYLLKMTGKCYRLLFFLVPFIFLSSVFRYCVHLLPGDLERLAEQGEKGRLSGTVYKVVETEKGLRLYLTDVTFWYSDFSGESDLEEESLEINSLEKSISSDSNILLYDSSGTEVQAGNRILVNTELQGFRRASNQGQYDEYSYQKSRGLDVMAYSEQLTVLDDEADQLVCLLYSLKKRMADVYDSALKDKNASVIKAMVLGEKNGLDEEIKTLYSENGISHVLAISGLHISMIGMIFYKILHYILLKSKWEELMPVRLPIKIIVMVNSCFSAVLSVIFIILYGIMTGFGVSTNRSVIMYFLSLLAGLVGRTYDFLTGILAAALVILYQQPLYISDSGFWLSFGAVLGIAVLLPELEAVFPKHKQNNRKTGGKCFSKEMMKKHLNFVCERLRSGLLVSVAVFFMTFPIVIKTYYFYPLYGVFLNLFVIPLMGILLPAALFMGVPGMLFPIVSEWFSVLVDGILILVEMLCTVTEKLPFAIQLTGQPSDEKILVYYIVLGGMIMFWKQKRKKARKMSSAVRQGTICGMNRKDNKIPEK